MTTDDQYKLDLILEGCRERPEELTEWESGFISSTEERYKKYGPDMLVSAKQWAILDRVYEKVVG